MICWEVVTNKERRLKNTYHKRSNTETNEWFEEGRGGWGCCADWGAESTATGNGGCGGTEKGRAGLDDFGIGGGGIWTVWWDWSGDGGGNTTGVGNGGGGGTEARIAGLDTGGGAWRLVWGGGEAIAAEAEKWFGGVFWNVVS